MDNLKVRARTGSIVTVHGRRIDSTPVRVGLSQHARKLLACGDLVEHQDFVLPVFEDEQGEEE